MSSPGSVAGLDQPPRKKMRKGTKSCIECRRRKIRCTYQNDRPNLCNECFARGSTCIDQEHGELQFNHNSGDQSYSLRERVTHLEDTIKGILHRLEDGQGSKETETQRAAEVLKNLKAGMPAPESTNLQVNGSAPVLSLFDNAVLTRKEDGGATRESQTLRLSYNQIKERKLCESLSALLPSQQDLTSVFTAASKWWRVWRRMFPELYASPDETLEEFTVHAYGATAPTTIAKTLLCTAISLDQLPPDFHRQNLSLPLPVEEMMEKYITTVHDLVTSDDDIAGTVEGIECMLLETKHYVNIGRPRKAWFTFRRAISFAELLGIHRAVPKPDRQSDRTYQRHYNLWCALVQGDRYLSLILGLPYSVSDRLVVPHIPKSMDETNFPPGEFYFLHLIVISGRIIDRNQDPTHMSLSASLRIDQELEELKASMPANMWNAECNPHEDVEGYFDRLVAQFFHHQIRTLLHLPFMLKSAAEPRYQYSKIAAIEASRDMLVCYQSLRSDSGIGPYICKVLDFQAFTAAMLLLLNLLGYAQGTPYKNTEMEENDWSLVTKIIDVLHRASNEAGGVIAAQSAKALELIASSRHGCDEYDSAASSKIVIPYFGTIRIGCGKSFAIPKPPSSGSGCNQLPTPPNSHLTGFNSSGTTPTACPGIGAYPMADHTQNAGPGAGADAGSASTAAPNFSEDPLISYDSLWAMPPCVPDSIYDNHAGVVAAAPPEAGYLGNSGMGAVNVGGMGPWPSVNMDLDQGWNWFGFENDGMPS